LVAAATSPPLHAFSLPTFFSRLGESRGGPAPFGGGSNVAAITRLFFAYFLFPLKRKYGAEKKVRR
jgi:hypothetical protein